MKYAVTAASGKLGSMAVKTLAKLVDPKDIIALARNTEKASQLLPKGIEVRPGDYTIPGDLHNALKGVDRLLFISSIPGGALPRIQEHLNVITAAKNNDVQYVAYTSFPHADEARAPLAEDHRNTELALNNSGLAHSFLRNNWYLEDELSRLKAAQAGEPFVYAGGEGRVGWALERFYAEAAAKVLVLDDPKVIYEFAGPAHTYEELAQAVASIAEKEFKVQALELDTFEEQAAINLGADTAKVVTAIQALIRDGELNENTTDFEDVLGYKIPSLNDQLKELFQ
ncbi:quinone oxidoreductase 2 [Agrilactobacillus composti DSM 18527 = JCM 14202]|uniref:Quinone oxidoreductase 2 n=2 Tax=Agrilactobacillus TaxID=2767875 RepID=A0A0R1YB25_9LACO|nr:NAD(P)H-binding protein [Agrilactobacillus composti]KRM36252.1 quinone oxidoreductase 2 [Agrilactobacillus composti DSM 18527 = JCM 14202]